MTPKEKAKELINNMLYCYQGNIDEYTAKQCALVCVEEMIEDAKYDVYNGSVRIKNWKEVKQEIEKL